MTAFSPGDLVILKSYPGSLARIIEVFSHRPGAAQPYAEIEFIQNNPFRASRHRVYLSSLRLPPEGFVAAVEGTPPEGT